MPGQAKTFSTSTFGAEAWNEKTMPRVVSTGRKRVAEGVGVEHGRGRRGRWRGRCGRSPAESTPSIEARVMRASGASTKSAMRDGGQDQLSPGSARNGRAVAGQQAVDQVDAGDGGRRRARRGRCRPSGEGADAQQESRRR
jgi:hypothetical protein